MAMIFMCGVSTLASLQELQEMSNGNRGEGTNARDLLARTIAKERDLRSQEFLAPYTEQSTTAIVKMDGVNYRFRIVGFQGSGFGVFAPIDPTCARFVRDGDFARVHEYLELLPQLYFILVCETDLGWCGYPFNLESAQRRLGVDCEVIIRNISDIERFDVVSVRCDGRNFWYHEPFSGADPVKADELRECFALRSSPLQMQRRKKMIKGLTPEEKKAFEIALTSWQLFQRQTTEGRLKEFLARGGAGLDGYVIRGNQIEITWQAKSGSYYKSRVRKETLDVVSAGICLSGADQRFHLKDLPGIIEQGEAEGAIYVTEDV
ncbi:MAG: hypothetical protein ACXAC5_01040 [Promethearchaeota archaeon]|jgi:hypothetical protein